MDAPTPPPPDQEPENQLKGMGSGYALGINFFVSVLISGAAGYGLDRWLDTKPLFLLIFIFLGFAAGIWQIWKALNKP